MECFEGDFVLCFFHFSSFANDILGGKVIYLIFSINKLNASYNLEVPLAYTNLKVSTNPSSFGGLQNKSPSPQLLS
jgi:hypothetical protein